MPMPRISSTNAAASAFCFSVEGQVSDSSSDWVSKVT